MNQNQPVKVKVAKDKEILAQPIIDQNSPFTHWYTDPETGDPKMLICRETPEGWEGTMHIAELCRMAAEREQWMAALFVPSQCGTYVKIHRCGMNFPFHLFPACKEVLNIDLDREYSPAQPLKIAQVVPASELQDQGQVVENDARPATIVMPSQGPGDLAKQLEAMNEQKDQGEKPEKEPGDSPDTPAAG